MVIVIVALAHRHRAYHIVRLAGAGTGDEQQEFEVNEVIKSIKIEALNMPNSL